MQIANRSVPQVTSSNQSIPKVFYPVGTAAQTGCICYPQIKSRIRSAPQFRPDVLATRRSKAESGRHHRSDRMYLLPADQKPNPVGTAVQTGCISYPQIKSRIRSAPQLRPDVLATRRSKAASGRHRRSDRMYLLPADQKPHPVGTTGQTGCICYPQVLTRSDLRFRPG